MTPTARTARRTAIVAATFTTLALLAPSGAAQAATHAPVTSANLIKDGGADKAPVNDGSVQVKVPGWTVAKGTQFTAVSYGAPSFPDASTPGPANRGAMMFTGGIDGAKASASQAIALTAYAKVIASGKATFTLSAWLGGYSDQADNARLTVTWRSAAGAALGHTTVGPVTAAARHNLTGMLKRAKTGAVPKGATKAVVTLSMTRTDGSYDDGYADSLSLTITG